MFVSEGWVRDFGYTREDARDDSGALLERIIHAGDMDRVVAHHRALSRATTDAPLTLRYRLRNKDGTLRWLSSEDRPLLRDDSGRVTRIVGHARDITAQVLRS